MSLQHLARRALPLSCRSIIPSASSTHVTSLSVSGSVTGSTGRVASRIKSTLSSSCKTLLPSSSYAFLRASSSSTCTSSLLSSTKRLIDPTIYARKSRNYASSAASSASTESAKLSHTPLYDFHVQHKAKMVPFARFEMPLTYNWGGQLKEHEQVRTKAGLFDVSHMVQNVLEREEKLAPDFWSLGPNYTSISGPGATRFMEQLVPSSMKALTPPATTESPFDSSVEGPFLSGLSVLLNTNGGIIDDLMVTRQGDESYYVVTNAGRRDEDYAHITKQLEEFNTLNKTGVRHDILENRGLLALQGPAAAEALQPHLPSHVDLSKLYFGQSVFTTFGPEIEDLNVRVHIARGGYTGEDGFEISIPGESSIKVAKALINGHSQTGAGQGVTQPIGLAARDSLRLEAGMCLYGHDLSEDVGPLEAALTWVVGEDRRANATFLGAEKTLEAMTLKAKTTRRVGLIVESGSPAREGTLLYAEGSSENDEPIGRVTSGIPSPTLKQNIAMGYVKFGYQKTGTILEVRLRGKKRQAKVTKMPFVKPNYYRQPK